MNLRTLVEHSPLKWLREGDAEISEIVTDSRRVQSGSLFMAREGWFVDSHQFIPSALEAGASALIVTRPDALPHECNVPVLLSEQEDRDLGLIADRFFSAPTDEMTVYAITGTNGKTSVSFLLEHILRAAGERVGVIGTVAYRFESLCRSARNTTPDGLTIHGFAREIRDLGATSLVMEASSHGIHLRRIAGTAFDVLGFTNLTPEHLDYHGSMDEYRAAKAGLFIDDAKASLARGKQVRAVFRADDDEARRMASLVPPGVNVRLVSNSGGIDGELCVVETSNDGFPGRYAVVVGAEQFEIESALVGAHNAENIAIALGMAREGTGAPWTTLVNAVSSFPGVPGRLEPAFTPVTDEPLVLVDYAHSPDAVARVCEAISSRTDSVTVVLGAGGDRDAEKRPKMAAAASRFATKLILTSDNPRSESPLAIIDAMRSGLDPNTSAGVLVEADRSRAIAAALRSDGTVLILGKGHETYQEIGGRRYAFDDREEARRLLGRDEDVSGPLLDGWSVERLAQACGGRMVRAGGRRPLRGLETDSRNVKPGSIFAAIVGERFDAHEFLPAVVSDGAACVIVERADAVPENVSVGVVEVADTVGALQRLAKSLLGEARRRRSGLETVGITGSNGKTTTKEIIGALCRTFTEDEPLVTPGNWNNHIGLPLTVAGIAANTRVAILEMGANQPGDIHELAEIASHEIAVLTSIGHAHVEGLGGIDGVRREKAGILTGLPPRVAILPHREFIENGWRERVNPATRVWTFGDDGATLEVHRETPFGPVELRGNGPLAGYEVEIELSLDGEHNARNLAAAMLVVGLLGRDEPVSIAAGEVERALANLSLPGGRLRRLLVRDRVIIDDAYNANPASMRASLSILALCDEPRVAVLGDMYELGERAEALHRELGAVAAEAADVVVGVGPRGVWIAEAVQAAGGAAVAAETLEEAVATVAEVAPSGATVLLKASRSMRLESMIQPLRERWEA